MGEPLCPEACLTYHEKLGVGPLLVEKPVLANVALGRSADLGFKDCVPHPFYMV